MSVKVILIILIIFSLSFWIYFYKTNLSKNESNNSSSENENYEFTCGTSQVIRQYNNSFEKIEKLLLDYISSIENKINRKKAKTTYKNIITYKEKKEWIINNIDKIFTIINYWYICDEKKNINCKKEMNDKIKTLFYEKSFVKRKDLWKIMLIWLKKNILLSINEKDNLRHILFELTYLGEDY